MARRFGADQIAPFAREWENAGTIPRDLWARAAALGFGGLYVGEDHGGSGLSRHDATLVFEALSMACPAVAAFLSIHNMAAGMIARFGDARAHARWLPRAVAMETIFSYCLTEPGSGSDAAALRTRAEARPDARGGGWVLNGTPGLSFGPPEDKVGWRAQPTAQAQFDDCLTPAQNLLGEEGRGFAYAVAGLDGGRLNIAACALGGAQYAMDKTLIYISERQAFGQSLDQFQALQFRLAEIEVKLQSARSFLHHAANMLDGGAADAAKFCAMAKL
ncbi:MAG: acyl-CoA dehydrogenase family protein, partial [Albidovulum sp.]